MKLRLFPLERVASMEEIDPWIETRGRWNGSQAEGVSTHSEDFALYRSLVAIGLLHFGPMALTMLAAAPLSVALVFLGSQFCRSTALLFRHRSRRIGSEHETAWAIDRISFIEPLVADALPGLPEAPHYLDADERRGVPFCRQLLMLAEELSFGSNRKEPHLVGAAAQCLLIERAN